MKRFLIVLLSLVSVASFSQKRITYLGGLNERIISRDQLFVDSLMRMPKRDNTATVVNSTKDTASMIWARDTKKLYYHDGVQWQILVDRSYLDTANTYTFANGVNQSGRIVRLGGLMTQTTNFDLNTFNWTFTNGHVLGITESTGDSSNFLATTAWVKRQGYGAGGGGGTPPAGSDMWVQFKTGSSLDAVGDFIYNKTTKTLVLGTTTSTGGFVERRTPPNTFSAAGFTSFPYEEGWFPFSNGNGTFNNVIRRGFNIDGTVIAQPGLYESMEPLWNDVGVNKLVWDRKAFLPYSGGTVVKLQSSVVSLGGSIAASTHQQEFRATSLLSTDLQGNNYFSLAKANGSGQQAIMQLIGDNPLFRLNNLAFSSVIDFYHTGNAVGVNGTFNSISHTNGDANVVLTNPANNNRAQLVFRQPNGDDAYIQWQGSTVGGGIDRDLSISSVPSGVTWLRMRNSGETMVNGAGQTSNSYGLQVYAVAGKGIYTSGLSLFDQKGYYSSHPSFGIGDSLALVDKKLLEAQSITLFNKGSGARDTVGIYHSVDSVGLRYVELLGSGNINVADASNNNKISKTFSITGVIPVANLGTGTPDNTKFLRGDGTWQVPAGGGGSPGGSNTQVQYNSSGSFAGSSSFIWNQGSTFLRVDGRVGINADPPSGVSLYAKITDNTGAPPPIARFENLGTSIAYMEIKSDSRTWAWNVMGSSNARPGNMYIAQNGTLIYEMDFVGNAAFGGHSLSSPPRVGILSDFAGQTADNAVLDVTNAAATFNTTGSVLTSRGAKISSISTRSSGSNALTNIGLEVIATSAQNNYAIITTGNIGANQGQPARSLESLDASNPQLRLTHTNTSTYTDFRTLSTGIHQVTYTGDRMEVKTGSVNRYAAVGGMVRSFFTDATTSGSAAQALYSWTSEASTLAATGQTLHFKYHGSFSGATEAKQLGFSFAGTNVLSSPLPSTAIGEWEVDGTIVRTGSSTARVTWKVTSDRDGSQNGFIYEFHNDLTGITWTNTNVLSIWVDPGSTGGETITALSGYIFWYPTYGTGAD